MLEQTISHSAVGGVRMLSGYETAVSGQNSTAARGAWQSLSATGIKSTKLLMLDKCSVCPKTKISGFPFNSARADQVDTELEFKKFEDPTRQDSRCTVVQQC